MTTTNKTPNYYKIALNKCSDKMLDLCRPSSEHIEDIATNVQYLVNWKGYKKYIDVSDDNIEVKENDKNYVFSKTHFLNSKHFKQTLIKDFTRLMGNVFIQVRPTPDSKFVISIKKKY